MMLNLPATMKAKLPPSYLDIAEDVEFGEFVTINVTEKLRIGAGSKIRDYSRIEGRDISIGKNFFMNYHAEIGGGSCFTKESKLEIGNNCHIGSYSIINTARKVKIGDEVGMGRFTNIYTHEAYLNPLEGFPCSFGEITIGNKVWIPSATILPNTEIGNNVVISLGAKIQGTVPSGSHVTRSGKLITNQYPKNFTKEEYRQLLNDLMRDYKGDFKLEGEDEIKIIAFHNTTPKIHKTEFDLTNQTIKGKGTANSEKLRNYLRRHGIRFFSELTKDGDHYE